MAQPGVPRSCADSSRLGRKILYLYEPQRKAPRTPEGQDLRRRQIHLRGHLQPAPTATRDRHRRNLRRLAAWVFRLGQPVRAVALAVVAGGLLWVGRPGSLQPGEPRGLAPGSLAGAVPRCWLVRAAPAESPRPFRRQRHFPPPATPPHATSRMAGADPRPARLDSSPNRARPQPQHLPASPTASSGPAASAPMSFCAIGEGAMGVVYAAYDEELERKVAQAHPSLATGRCSAAHLHPPRSCRPCLASPPPMWVHVYQVGEVSGRVYIAMEFINGTTLTRWQAEPARRWQDILPHLRRRRPRPARRSRSRPDSPRLQA